MNFETLDTACEAAFDTSGEVDYYETFYELDEFNGDGEFFVNDAHEDEDEVEENNVLRDGDDNIIVTVDECM